MSEGGDGNAAGHVMRYTSGVIAPPELAAYAADLSRAFGEPVDFAQPADERGRKALRARLVTVLHTARPHPDGPSIAEALRPLIDDAARGQLAKSRSAKMLAELQAVFIQASFRRTKRAERGRLFAQLIVVFELEAAVGIDAATVEGGDGGGARDTEAHLRRVRRALRVA